MGAAALLCWMPTLRWATALHRYFNRGGSAIVIHAAEDDYKTDPLEIPARAWPAA